MGIIIFPTQKLFIFQNKKFSFIFGKYKVVFRVEASIVFHWFICIGVNPERISEVLQFFL